MPLEWIISVNCVYYLEYKGLLPKEQFGFRKLRSPESRFLLTYHGTTSWHDCGMAVDLVLTDFLRAFDVVSQSILLSKLQLIGIPDLLILCIFDFITGSVICGGSLIEPLLGMFLGSLCWAQCYFY